MARLTASRSSLFLIGLPTGIAALLDEDAFAGDGVLVGDGVAGRILAVFFRSFGNRRGLVPFELVSDCVLGGTVGWGCCRLLANPVAVGLLGVLRVWG